MSDKRDWSWKPQKSDLPVPRVQTRVTQSSAKPRSVSAREVPSCRKCGKPLSFVRRDYNGVMKWCPVNPDGSDHWDDCRQVRYDRMTPEEQSAQRARDVAMCPPFWTWADSEGKRQTAHRKPDWWDAKVAAQEWGAEGLF